MLGLLTGLVAFALECLRVLSSSTFLHSHCKLNVSFNLPIKLRQYIATEMNTFLSVPFSCSGQLVFDLGKTRVFATSYEI